MTAPGFIPERPPRWSARAAATFTAAIALAGGLDASAEVALTLRIPPASTWVIGDPIPLFWRFENKSDQTLAFMWEGCCRLNGQLEVSTQDGPIPTAPPGQALAHMFARADQLPPGVPKEYETLVSDWVDLPGSGAYTLRGTYRGVLPTQFPQVARGLSLWRDAALSNPIQLSVLSPSDYLDQREQREQARRIRVRLEGPSELPPIGETPFSVTFENLSDEPRTLTWPEDVALWTLDPANRRAVPAAVIDAPVREIEIPARGRARMDFTIPSDRFEGEPLARYRLFVDLAASKANAGEPRVPSNLLSVDWLLDADEVAALVTSASQGSRTGARNAPLKFLRVYLADAGDALRQAAANLANPDARALAERLSLAARLKPIAPTPGVVELTLRLEPKGRAVWTDPRVAQVATATQDGAAPGVEAQVSNLLDLRRHLGWDIRLLIEPDANVTVGDARAAVAPLAAFRDRMATPPAARLDTDHANLPAHVILNSADSAPSVTLRIDSTGRRQWSPDGRTFVEWTEDHAARLQAPASIRVETPHDLPWSELISAIGPLISPGAQFHLAAATSAHARD